MDEPSAGPDAAESAVDAWIRAHRALLVRTLGDLVEVPTPSPPGRNTGPAQALVRARLERLGCAVDQWDVYPGDPDVVGVRRGLRSGEARSLLLHGHIDVAEVGDPSPWSRPPFRLTVEGDRAYGRGTADMKGGLAAGLVALEAVEACGARLLGDVVFESVVGEEQGEAGTADACARGYRADLAVAMDTSGLAVQGQGGVVTGWIVVESPETFHDGLRGRMIHAGGGLHGAGAIEKMCRLIAALGDLERHWAVVLQYPGFPPGSTTINPAVIEGGRHPAFVADRCALWITVHFYPDRRWEEVAQEVEAFVRAAAAADPWLALHPPAFRWGGKSMLVDRGEVFPPVPLDPAHPGVAALLRAHGEIAGAPAAVGMSRSVSDGGWLAAAGMATAIYGPGRLEQAHAVDEWVDLREVETAARVLARLMLRWCGT